MDRRTFLKRLGLGAAAAAVVLPAADSLLVEPRWIDVTRHNVPFGNWPAARRPLNVVQLSDIHSGPYMGRDNIADAVALCNRLKPDLVALTGDFVHRGLGHIGPCAHELSKLTAPLGAFAVLGNHDHWEGAAAVADALSDAGITMLTNRNVDIGHNVFVAGLDDEWTGRPDERAAFAGVIENAATIVLAHSPRSVARVAHRNCLLLSGHTHGGQVDVKIIPRNRLPLLQGWKYIKGWYTEDRARMYVNRGIGMVGLPIRFLCRPEISVFHCGAPGDISGDGTP
jgi:hypothetical protein